jgi:hypothetical protein
VNRPFTVEGTMADNADLVRGRYTDTWQVAQVTGITPAT